ncbi:MAG: alpha/beta fold hydrolase [Rhodovarius sp.]|nr:alpha/beta fold hydrolase [Rhodovarius sp.]MDW8315174.1 alpha/beta fold hydrolase [Rhodovarius sp.]
MLHFLPHDGAMLAVAEEGPPGAPAVVMLHSLGASSLMWAPQREALARRYRVVAMDLPGHGLSAPPVAEELTMPALAAAVFAVMDKLGIRAAHVAGLSIGGRIAMEMAATAPDRVLSLMLCDTALTFPPRERWEGRMAAIREGGMAAIAQAVVANWVVDASLPSAAALLRMLEGCHPRGYAACAAALRDVGPPGPIACPTTVICGAADPATPPARSQEITAHIPGARYVEIAGAAHIPCFEQEAAMTAALEEHLSRVAAAGG